LIERYGLAKARRLFELAMEARAVTLDLIARHAIACDLKNTGHLLLAAKPRDVSDLQREADALAGPMGYAQARLLSAQDARAEVAAANYHGALLDEQGGHLHPLNYTLGLAEAARKAGVQIFESSRVTSIESENGFRAKTAHGAVRAKFGVLACDAFAGEADPRFIGAVMPVANYICATAPLPDPRAVIAQDRAVSDSRFVVNYFRLSADGRMLFGGGERYSPRAPADMAGFVRGHMARVFPQLAQTPIDYAWGGLVSITSSRLPHFGRRGDMVFAHGYSGQGVLLSALAGKLMAEALTGVAEKFDLFASVAPTPFPGGAGLRDPLYVLGMLYYALRDRL
jgi:gamma-glutamylputrescine oxidase